MKRICRAMVVLSIAAFLLLTTVSIAPATDKGPFYVGVFGGLVMPDDLEVEGSDVSLDDSFTLGLKGGYIIPQNPWIAVELEYNYQGEQDFDETIGFTAAGDRVGIDGNLSSHNLMANLLFRYPKGKVHPFVGGGIGFSMATAEANVTVQNLGSLKVLDDDDTAFAWQLIAGVNFEVAPQVSVDLTYKYFNADYEFSSDYPAYVDNFDADSTNHIVALGVNYHF